MRGLYLSYKEIFLTIVVFIVTKKKLFGIFLKERVVASSWIRTSDVLAKRDYESRAIVHSAIDAKKSFSNVTLFF